MSETSERAEMERLGKHIESVGMDATRVKLTEVFEAMFVMARSHPDESVKTEYGEALLGMWACVETCHEMLASSMDDDTDKSRLH